MKIVYSPRAIRDLAHIATYYCSVADAKIATAISKRIEQVVDRIAQRPLTAPRVVKRSDVAILVLRHTARQTWTDETE